MKVYCEICGHHTSYQSLFSERSYEVCACEECGVRRTLPVPDLNALYTDILYNYQANPVFQFLKNILLDWEIKRIVKTTGLTQFLDLGCGAGDLSLRIRRHGYDVVAADAFIKKPVWLENMPDIPYVHFDFGQNRLEDSESVAGRIVILRHVLEHVKDPASFLSYFIEQKAAGFYVALPNAGSFEVKLFKKYSFIWYVPYHLWHFDAPSLTKLFNRLNISIVKTGYDTIPSVLPNLYRYCVLNNYPQWFCKLLNPEQWKLALTVPLNIFFPFNVVWIVGKCK